MEEIKNESSLLKIDEAKVCLNFSNARENEKKNTKKHIFY